MYLPPTLAEDNNPEVREGGDVGRAAGGAGLLVTLVTTGAAVGVAAGVVATFTVVGAGRGVITLVARDAGTTRGAGFAVTVDDTWVG